MFTVQAFDLQLIDGIQLLSVPRGTLIFDVGIVPGKGVVLFGRVDTEKERHPRGVSDDPRPRMEKACERLSEPLEPERARAFWCLPPAPFFGFLYRNIG